MLGHFGGIVSEEYDHCVKLESSIKEYQKIVEKFTDKIEIRGAACYGMKTTSRTSEKKQRKELLRVLNERTEEILTEIVQYKQILKERLWLKDIGNVHKYAREEDRPEKTLFIITTDGMENASRKYSYDRLKVMIRRQKEQYGWEFIFRGANIDAAKEAARFGIDEDRAANYHADHQGTAVIYEAVSEAVCSVRACRPMDTTWKRRVDEDYKSRAK